MLWDSKLSKHTFRQINPFDLTGPYHLPNLPDLAANWFAAGATFHSPALPEATGTQTVLYAPDGGAGSAAQPGPAGRGGAGGGTASAAPSSLRINIAWDASVQSAPGGFTAAVMSAARYLEAHLADPVTVNISVGYGEVNGSALGNGALGASQSYLSRYSYAALKNALSADATSADDASAAASLPGTSPVAGTFWTTTAQAKALGLAAADGTATDGFVGFSSTLPFTYDTSSGVAPGTYDFNGVVLHEMTEVMGRMLLTGATIGSTPNSYDLLDLLHYASPGVRDFNAGTPGYLSVDAGNGNLGTFNTISGGDAGDWASSMGADAFDAFTPSGVVNPVATNDLRAVDAIGWNRATVATPTGVAFAPATTALSGAQAATGLAGGAAIAPVQQVGGSAGDSYAYALGGTDAASFTLSSTGGAGTLAVGAGGLAGAIDGRAYALAVTATDTTSGDSAPASPLQVIVGSDAADTVSVAALSGGLGTETPSLMYGLGGADAIDGRGMSGSLWLTGGTGADTMTGGSGANHYLYAGTGESTPAAMDVITNFNPSMDTIDLTGLGQPLRDVGMIRGGTLGAGSVGWQTSGGDNFVYVNTSGGSEALTHADMKMELLGSAGLGSSNFALA